jgi:glutamyl-tRNA reductase
MRSAADPRTGAPHAGNRPQIPEEVIEYLANTLTNRLLHSPTQALRQAAESAIPRWRTRLPACSSKNANSNESRGRYNPRP